jgi:small subunit ribosomal protein S16
MLTIRLTRKGKKNQPFFRVVVIDKRRSSKGGRAVEDLGYVDPLTKRKNFKKDRVLYWISKGAKPSPSIHNLLVSEKIIDAKKINVSKISKKKQAEIDVASASAKATADEAKVAAAPASVPAAQETAPAPAVVQEAKPAEAPKQEANPEVKPAA